MKNCTSDVHKEILSQEFMGVMKSLVTSSRVSVGTGIERQQTSVVEFLAHVVVEGNQYSRV